MSDDNDSLITTEDSSAVEDSPPPLVGGPVGIPFAFALIWPLIRLVAVPLIQAVLPALLRKIADTLDSGEPGTIGADELGDLIDGQKGQMQAHYEGHQA